ncbi:MAG: hypothetical protein ACRELX_01070 [Longimicrobiales bacterium]
MAATMKEAAVARKWLLACLRRMNGNRSTAEDAEVAEDGSQRTDVCFEQQTTKSLLGVLGVLSGESPSVITAVAG